MDVSTGINAEGRLVHLAFIMDGNGRWAKKRGLPRSFGHKAGAKTFKRIARYCGQINIKYVTVYAFSTENWKRPENEVRAIMDLLSAYLDECIQTYKQYNMSLKFIGDLTPLDVGLKQKIAYAEKLTEGMKMTLNIAVNYGGRGELVHAFNKLIAEGKKSVTEEDISGALYTAGCPNPDMIVRTGGDLRISNYLLWQSAYSELYFTDVLWPDLDENTIDEIVKEFYSRERRFGAVGNTMKETKEH